MANRRMLNKQVIDSDQFLDMPLSAQCLYFHLCMRADDDGFIDNPKKIMRMVSAREDDLKILLAKSFILAFDNGVIVIRHWRLHNYIKQDRYKSTLYSEEKALLGVDENNVYTLEPQRNQIGTIMEPQRNQSGASELELEKELELEEKKDTPKGVSKEKKAKAFIPPTINDVKTYCLERRNNVDPEKFYDFYTSKGWYVGKNRMKDWKAAVRTWEKEDNLRPPKISHYSRDPNTKNTDEVEDFPKTSNPFIKKLQQIEKERIDHES